MWFMIALSFALSTAIIPPVIHMCRKYGWYDTVNSRKVHKGNIPRLGSTGFVPAFCIACIVYFLYIRTSSVTLVLPLVISAFIIFVFGVADDFLDMPEKVKLLFQVIAALIVLCSGCRFKQICFWQMPVWFSYVLTFGWIIGITNAFNLIDGVDGLCGGLSFLILCTLGIIYFNSAVEMSAVCFILAAAVAGFLVYNLPPAKIFMGDGGSQFLGFIISVLPLYKASYNFEYNKLFMMIVLVSIPMTDTIAAIWRRKREHRSFFTADRSHLHHKLMNIGYSRKQILVMLLSLQTLLCLTAGIAMYMKEAKGAVLLFVVYVFVATFFSIIHFTNRAVLSRGLKPIKEGEEK